MFALFYSLYYSMFVGTWTPFAMNDITTAFIRFGNTVVKALTSIFGDFQIEDFGAQLGNSFMSTNNQIIYVWLSLVAFILALITSIGIVVMAVKGVKKAFGIFFMGLR